MHTSPSRALGVLFAAAILAAIVIPAGAAPAAPRNSRLSESYGTIPLSFDRVPVNPPPCWFVMTITASQWSAPYGDTPQCAG